MVRRTAAAFREKRKERQHRMTPVHCTNLWRPTVDRDEENGCASFLLGPVPSKELPSRKSDKIRRSPVRRQQQKRPSTGRNSRMGNRSNHFKSAKQPVRPSTSGGNNYRGIKSVIAVQNAKDDFPPRPETLSATSIFDETESASVLAFFEGRP